MATTTNYSWTTPDNTAYVKDGASSIRTLGSSVDTTLFTALGGAYPGLRLIKKQTIGSAVSSVNVTGAFSATYDAYKIVVSSGVGSTTANIMLRLGASTASYSHGVSLLTYSTAAIGGASEASGAQFAFIGAMNSSYINVNCDLVNPFLTKQTYMSATYSGQSQGGNSQGVHQVASSYTDFTLLTSSGTITGGTIYVYGYGIS